MAQNLKEQVTALIEGPLKDEGCELAEVVLSQYKGSFTLKLFVYSPQGVSLDRCAELSDLVGDLIDGTDLFENGYLLEVSSPGLDRPLKQAIDYKYRVGESIIVEFVEPKRKKIQAEIISATDTDIELKDDSGTFRLPLSEVKQSKIVF
ncbi:MAG TPA: ribosome maturation factor RimP [candidate division Zixibacteria bacterium]|nr:ribosome maturation factor RimP [candidate division Zixibacteria bacterium]